MEQLLEQIRKERLLNESLQADNTRMLDAMREKDELHKELLAAGQYIAQLEDKTY